MCKGQRGEGAALEARGGSLGRGPQRASSQHGSHRGFWAATSTLLLAPELPPSWTPTPLRAGGSGFRIWCPHRNHVWWADSQPGSEGPTSHLVRQGGGTVGPRPKPPQRRLPTPPQRASLQGSGLQASLHLLPTLPRSRAWARGAPSSSTEVSQCLGGGVLPGPCYTWS